MNVEKMRAFIIKFVFYCLIFGLSYFVAIYALPVITPFLVAFVFAFFLQPFIRRVAKKTKGPKPLIAVLTLIAFYALLSTFIVLVGSQIVIALRDFILDIPSLYKDYIEPAILEIENNIEGFLMDLNPQAFSEIAIFESTVTSSLSSLVSDISSSALGYVTSFATGIPNMVFQSVITVVASFFLVCDYDKVASFIYKAMPKKAQDTMTNIKTRGISVLFQYSKAYALLLSITCGELFVGFLLLGVENAFLFAVLIAIVDIFPILGTGTILIPWGITMLILGNTPFGIGILIIYVIITVVRQILEPRIVGNYIGLYPLVTLMCMFVGASLFGFLGLLGLPMLVTLLVQLTRSGDIKWFK